MPEWTREIRARLDGLKLDPAREQEIVDELSLHLQDRFRDLVDGGMTEGDASHAIAADLRDPDRLRQAIGALKQAHAEAPVVPGRRPSHLLRDLRQDMRYAARMLTKQPLFTTAAVVTLALGIGANTAVFSLINATLLQRLPVADSSTLVYVNPRVGGTAFSYPDYRDLRDAREVLSGLMAWGGITASLNSDGLTDLVTGAVVTGNYFELLGVRAGRGRLLASTDDVTPGAHPVAVISQGLWRARFGARENIVGTTILLNGHTFTIVGVTPANFFGAQLGVTRDIYVPMMMQAVVRPPRAGYSGEMDPDLLKVRTNRWLFEAGRLAPGVSREQAEQRLSALSTAAFRANGGAPTAERPVSVTPIDDGPPGVRAQTVPVARLLMATVGAVLLIACANVANLLLARAASRRREMAVRLAIGANRGRLVRQLLTESVLLALLGGAAGLGLAAWLVSGWRAAPPPAGALPMALDFAIDARVLTFSFALSLATGVLFGVLPALRASKPSVAPALKDETFVEDQRRRRFNLKQALVVGQIALSLLLLLAAGLFSRSFRNTLAIDPGFDAEKLLTVPLNVNLLRYTKTQGRQFYRDVVERVSALPGVESAAVARGAALISASSVRNLLVQGRPPQTIDQFRSEGGGFSAAGSRDIVAVNAIGPHYFQTMGIPIVQGRDFSDADAEDRPLVVMANESFAAMHFPGQSAIGQRVSAGGTLDGPWREIVGVVRDSKIVSLREASTPVLYLPLQQNHESGVVLHVRASVDPLAVVGSVRGAIQQLEPNLPLSAATPMTNAIGTALYPERMGAVLIGASGALALVLAAVGIYGVMAFTVSRRTRELGIRLSLGAQRRQLFGLVLGDGLRLVAFGVAAGLVIAFVGLRALESFLYGVTPTDTLTFAVVSLLLSVVALAACYLPARRATRIDPLRALRTN